VVAETGGGADGRCAYASPSGELLRAATTRLGFWVVEVGCACEARRCSEDDSTAGAPPTPHGQWVGLERAGLSETSREKAGARPVTG
jgi:hypothetical protein